MKSAPAMAYKWLKRYRRQRHSPQRTAPAVDNLMVMAAPATSGLGGRKLRRRLMDLGQRGLPATSTVTDIQHCHGLIAPERTRAAQTFQRFERAAPNQLWQVGFKGHFALSEGRCHPLRALDDYSRDNVLLAVCADQQEQTVQAQLAGAFRRHGLPDGVLWDNGSPWAMGDEYTDLDVWLMRLGIGVHHGRAYHPQTQGKEERFIAPSRPKYYKAAVGTTTRRCKRLSIAGARFHDTQRPH